jgi:hypothetical protein
MVQQLYAQDTCLYVSGRPYMLQIRNLVNVINIEPRGHSSCQVKISVSGRSLVQKSPTECGVCLSVIVELHRGDPGSLELYSYAKI